MDTNCDDKFFALSNEFCDNLLKEIASQSVGQVRNLDPIVNLELLHISSADCVAYLP